jgi:hypothetical protein
MNDISHMGLVDALSFNDCNNLEKIMNRLTIPNAIVATIHST